MHVRELLELHECKGALPNVILQEETQWRSGPFFKAELAEHRWTGLAHTGKFEPVIYPWHFINLWMANSMVLKKHRSTAGVLEVSRDFSMDFNKAKITPVLFYVLVLLKGEKKCSFLSALCFLHYEKVTCWKESQLLRHKWEASKNEQKKRELQFSVSLSFLRSKTVFIRCCPCSLQVALVSFCSWVS